MNPLYVEWNLLGVFPLPNEAEAEFVARAERLLASARPVSAEWSWAFSYLQSMWGVLPTWVPLTFSNRGLSIWEGGCCWIDASGAQIQLRLRLKDREALLLGLCSRQDIFVHEVVHALRFGLQGDKWEEWLAHMTSKSLWRRVLGPWVQSSFEVWTLFMSLWLAWLMSPMWAFLTVGLCSYFSVRLMWRHYVLSKAAYYLQRWIGDATSVRSLLLRMSDREIELWSTNRFTTTDDFSSLRWQVFQRSYIHTAQI
jgi:hypothetical protein